MTQPLTEPRPPTTTPPRPRLAYLDKLRILLTALVVIHHAAITYSGIPAWYYLENPKDSTTALLFIVVVFNQSFFMGFFFLIAGFFTPGAVDRKGKRKFMRDRLIRLGIPLLFFILLLRPLLTLPMYLSEFADELPYWLFYVIGWDPGPMWFVEVLLVATLGYVLVRRGKTAPADKATVAPGGPAVAPAERAPGRMPNLLWILGFIAALSLVTYAWRFLVPSGSYWPVIGLPTPYFLPQYLSMFAIGCVAFRRGWFGHFPRSTMWVSGVGAFVSLAVTVLGLAGDPKSGELPRFLNDLAECSYAVFMITFLLSLFHRVANRRGAKSDFLARHAFAVYLFHPLVLVAGGYALSGWDAVAVAKFGVLALIGLPACWAVAWLVLRIPVARRIL